MPLFVIEMAQSIVRFGPLANVIVYVGTLKNDAEEKEANEISKITQYHDFEFTSDGVLARRQSGIGPGKKIKLKVMKHTPEFIIDQTYKDTVLKAHTNEMGLWGRIHRPGLTGGRKVYISLVTGKQKLELEQVSQTFYISN